MAYTIITTDQTSTVVAGNGDDISLAPNAGIYVNSTGILSNGTNQNVSVWVHGSIIANNAIYLGGTSTGDSTGTGSYYVYMGADSIVQSLDNGNTGVFAQGSDNTVVNYGAVVAGGEAILINGANGSVSNYGTLTSEVAGISFSSGAGSIQEAINGGIISSVNYGVHFSTSALNMTNSGTIDAGNIGVYAGTGAGAATLVNTGTITGALYALQFAGTNDEVTNHGSLFGDIQFEDGVNTLVNTGLIDGLIEFGIDVDTFTNSGHVEGDVDLLGGNDIFDGRGGTVSGEVRGGLGDDTYIVDNTNINLVEAAASGTDEIQTTVDYTLGANFENLTLLGNAERGVGNTSANTITGNEADNVLRGRANDDVLNGGGGNDKIFGGMGNDTISGGDDDDKLYGRSGNDIIIGGAGRDTLFGGAGADVFVYNNASDSRFGFEEDKIKDFQIGTDLIDLNNVIPGTFTFIGTGAFTGTASEVRATESGSNTLVRMDTDGDGIADMKIILQNVTGLTDVDFIL